MEFTDRRELENRNRESLSVIICAYTMARLDQLLASCQAAHDQLTDGDELIVVIDYNAELLDSVTQWAKAQSQTRARVIPNTETKGLSGARNTGVKATRNNVVAFVDDDAAVTANWADTMLAHYADPAVAGVGGFAKPVWPTGEAPDWMPEEFYWVVGCSHVGLPTTVSQVRNFIGCNMSFRREVFDTVGGFDAEMGRVGKIPVGCEETELCIRYSQARPVAKLLFDPDMRVAHHVSSDRTTWKYFRRRCYGEGISKRRVSQLVGASDGLSTERDYVARILPLAFFAAILETFRPRPRRARTASLARCFAIILGIATTAFGYARSGVLPGGADTPGTATRMRR